MAGSHHVEQAEQTAHVRSKHIGLTMALIGVLIACCSAMVGSQRNEVTRTMIEQTQAHSDFSSASTKFRVVMLELEKRRAALSAEAANPVQVPGLKRFLRLYVDYNQERALAKMWADSYQPLITAHFNAAESYERAQLIAEIGIMIASLAVLLSNRPAGLISIALAVVCVAILANTFVKTRSAVSKTSDTVQQAEHAYQELRKTHLAADEDEQTIEQLDPGAKIRAEIKGEDP